MLKSEVEKLQHLKKIDQPHPPPTTMPPPPPSPPDPPNQLLKRPMATRTRSSEDSEILSPVHLQKASDNPSLSPKDKILAAWRKCASNVLQNGNIAVHPAVFDMMEAFIESVKEFKEMIKKMDPKSSTAPSPTPLPQHPLPPKPTKSWANAAKTNLTPAFSLPAPMKPPSNRAINEFKSAKVVIRVPESTDPFFNIQPKDLLCKINVALLSVGAKIGDTPIKALGAARMESGDLIIHTANRPTARWLLWNRHLWSVAVHKDFITSRPSFPVLLQSVPASYDPSAACFSKELTQQNHLPVDAIQDCRWLVKPTAPKKHGSVIVSFVDKDLANKIGRGDLFLDGLCLPGKPFDRSPLQCHQCQGIGHVASRCRHLPICAKCGEGHNTRDCINEDVQTCAQCIHHDIRYSTSPVDKLNEKYSHSPKSLTCPLRKRRLNPIDYSDLYSSTQ